MNINNSLILIDNPRFLETEFSLIGNRMLSCAAE
jgi:hypothetical protein